MKLRNQRLCPCLIAVIGEKQRDLRLDQLFTDGGADTTAAANDKCKALRIGVGIVTNFYLRPPRWLSPRMNSVCVFCWQKKPAEWRVLLTNALIDLS